MIVKYGVPPDVYYDSGYMRREAVKRAFDANGIEIPYPQLEVHTKSDGRESK